MDGHADPSCHETKVQICKSEQNANQQANYHGCELVTQFSVVLSGIGVGDER